MKYLKESLNEEYIKVPIATIEWDDIKPPMADMVINVPEDSATDMGIWNENRFDNWYEQFIRHYGNDGYLVQGTGRSYTVVGNERYDTEKKQRAAAMAGFRSTSRYQGD